MMNLALVAVAVVTGASLTLILPWFHILLVGGGALVCFLLLHRVSLDRVRSRPRLSVLCSLGSYGFIFLTVALSTVLGVLVAEAVPSWIAATGSSLSETVSGVVTGAISGLIGAAWLDNAKDTDGGLWPEVAWRKALGQAFAGDAKLDGPRTSEAERLYQAAYDDAVDGTPLGWGFAARWRRAEIVRIYDT